jgi:hypothetical protein
MKMVPFSTPPSPLAFKRRRLDSNDAHLRSFSPSPANNMVSIPVDMDFTQDPFIEQLATPLRPSPPPNLAPFIMGSPPTEITPRTKRSYAMLEADSHEVRLEMLKLESNDKTTKKIYERGVGNYCEWWEQNQLKVITGDTRRVAISAFPITAAKVAMFLQHEMTREKKKVCASFYHLFSLISGGTDCRVKRSRKGGESTIAGSSVGASHIKVIISALENARQNEAYKYKHIPESQVNLRSDIRIRAFESASKHNEPQRADKAHILKAAGSSAGNFFI